LLQGPPGRLAVTAREQPQRESGSSGAASSRSRRPLGLVRQGRAAPPPPSRSHCLLCCRARRLAASWPRPATRRGAVRRSVPAELLLLGPPGRGVASCRCWCCWRLAVRLRSSAARPAAAACSSLARPPVVGPTAPGHGSRSARPATASVALQGGFRSAAGRLLQGRAHPFPAVRCLPTAWAPGRLASSAATSSLFKGVSSSAWPARVSGPARQGRFGSG